MICKNCNNNFEGKFCNNCGQSSNVKRINFNYFVNELPNSIFQMDRGFFFTVKELFIRPGHSIREFLLGKRKQHYKPVAFLLVTSTLYVLVAYLMDHDTFVDDLISGWKSGHNETHSTSNFVILDWIVKYQAYFPILILPFYSLSTYLAFVKSKYNYFEHLVINFYITGQQMIIYLTLGLIFSGDDIYGSIPDVVGWGYNFWVFNQFFKDKKFLTKLGLMGLTYLIFVIQIIIFVVLAGGVFKIFE